MQLQQLMYFVTVAEQGSINKTAKKLFVTQPNLSKAIGNLESELKARIFDWTNKGVILTEDGKKLYQYARTILNQMELISGLSAKERLRIFPSLPIQSLRWADWSVNFTIYINRRISRSSWWSSACSRCSKVWKAVRRKSAL